MSSNRGIFESFNNRSSENGASPAPQANSPFAIAADNANKQPSSPSPFAIDSSNPSPAPQQRKSSPFAVVPEDQENSTSKLPERRKPNETPFQIAEPQGYGFEAQPKVATLENAPSVPAPRPAPQASPFSMEQPPAAPAPAPAPVPQSSFGAWPHAEANPQRSEQTQPQPQHAAAAPEAPKAPQTHSGNYDSSDSDSSSIKQLELRAIFGVDREMTPDEIIQRARSLPGIRQIARVNDEDVAAVDALKKVISNLGFGSSPIKLYSGSVPIEFIREGRVLLAIQTDGGFAPGVRETMMIVARELGR